MSAFANARDKASKSIKKAGSTLGITKSEEPAGVVDELSDMCPNLTYQQRMTGFGVCFVLGYMITFLSFSFFVDLVDGDPVPFVVIYTLGNIISLFSSMFLCGPKRQFKNMFDKKRKITTIVYLSTLLTSIIICFIKFDDAAKLSILILLLIVQCLASTWYNLSYIPFARKAVKKCCRSTFGVDDSV